MPKGVFERADEHRANISKALTGKPKSEAHRLKMSAMRKGVPWNDPDGTRRQKLLDRWKDNHPTRGKTLSDEWKRKLSESHKGKAVLLIRYGISPETYASELAAGNKWCWFGKHFKPADEFPKTKRGVCAGCNTAAHRKTDLKKLCGVDQAWYESKLAEQDGGCAVCGKHTPSGSNKHMPVDHNHTTGLPRGVLCSRCNTAIERLEVVPDWGIKALAYLARYK